MCQICKEVIQPSLKLKRIVNLIKMIFVFYIVLMTFDIFFVDADYAFMIFCQMIIILLGIGTKHFGYILTSLVYIIFVFSLLLFLFYIGIRESSTTEIYNNKLLLCFSAFLFSFEAFTIYILFQFYKQAKHEYRIQYGFVAEDDLEGNNNDNNNDGNDNEQLLQVQPL